MLNIKSPLTLLSTTCVSLLLTLQVQAALITFDDALNGETSYLFDSNSDGISDVNFSTTDVFGFNTAGPGVNQLFVNEPGLEGTTGLTPDLRVDLLTGGVDEISFGFATISNFPGVVQVFDINNQQIASEVFIGELFNLDTGETSSFPENFVEVGFDGVAAYVTIDFDSDGGDGRYIIDNFMYSQAGNDTLEIFEGSDPDFPILPDPFDPENPEFAFDLEIIEDGLGTLFPIFIDPIIAVGYTYAITGTNVETILIPTSLPNGDSQFSVIINGIAYDLFAGITFDIEVMTGIVGGVDYFEILDIATNEAVDPTNSLAFNTGLTFSSAGSVNVVQTPITINTDVQTVPEPSTLLLLIVSICGMLAKSKSKA